MGTKPCKGFGITDDSSLQTSTSDASSRSTFNPPSGEINSLAMDGMSEEEEEDERVLRQL